MATGPPTLGPKAARGDDADLGAAGRRDHRALAGWRTAFGQDADAAPGRALADFADDARMAGKAPFLTATLLDRPVQRRLDRGGLRVDIMAIKAIAGLEPQRIARPQPDRLHRLMRGELVPQGERIIVGHPEIS